jgi:hypothetical protein
MSPINLTHRIASTTDGAEKWKTRRGLSSVMTFEYFLLTENRVGANVVVIH